jgi:hypothetical protein
MDPNLPFSAPTGLPITLAAASPSTLVDVDSPQKPQSVSEPDPTAEAALRRAARAAFFSASEPAQTDPAEPTFEGPRPVSVVDRRTVTLSAARGTPSEKALNLAVAVFQLFESSSTPEVAPQVTPDDRFKARTRPEAPRISGRPPILREGEVFSPDGRGSSGFSSLTELARAIHCTYPALVAKWHSAVQEQQIDPESHHGFEFVHKGHRVKVFPNYVPEA